MEEKVIDMSKEDFQNTINQISNEKINPIIKQIAHMIMDVFEIGFNTGMDIGQKINIVNKE